LIPSPTIATMRPAATRLLMRASFISGNKSAPTSLIPSSWATSFAIGSVSPVSRTLRMPMRFKASIARFASGRTVSATTIAPSSRPSRATKISDEVSPLAEKLLGTSIE
jgi:hypothetical protein